MRMVVTTRRRLEIVDPHAPGAETIWRDLERAARPSYFLTWGWIENWLAMLPRDETPALAVIREGGEATGAFFLGRRLVFRHRVLPSRALFVNATGVPRRDELCIEHNGVLGRACSLQGLIELLPGGWDELFLPGVDRDAFRDLDLPPGFRMRAARTSPSPFVDLGRVRQTGDYLALVSTNTRAQIRRARRRLGACGLEVAASVAEALAIYDELVALHAATWRARGQPGAFADPWFDRFHRRLIARRFPHGEIQLTRLVSGTTTIGCLYNLVANGRVLFYQSGLAAFDDPVIKPGLLCHAAGIERAAADGHDVYDLLGGHGRYKAQLATGATELAWLCVQRTRLRFAIEDRMRDLKHTFAGARP
jgi:CelD/BcsL family acetyltransferase involved in cellulose biosynthesis